MFRFTWVRRTVAALCMALLMGGVVGVGGLGDSTNGWVPHEFALHVEVQAQECFGGDQGDRPECEPGTPGGGGGSGGGRCGFRCWWDYIRAAIGLVCTFWDCRG